MFASATAVSCVALFPALLRLVSFGLSIWGIVVGSGLPGKSIGVWLIVQGGVGLADFVIGCLCNSGAEQENGEKVQNPCTQFIHQVIQLFTLGWLSYGIYLFAQFPQELNDAFQVILWFEVSRFLLMILMLMFVSCLGCLAICGIIKQGETSSAEGYTTSVKVILNGRGTNAITLV